MAIAREFLIKLFDQVYEQMDWGGPDFEGELQKFLEMARIAAIASDEQIDD